MNNRMITVVATAMLVTLTSGCRCNLSNLWFGRGASCGLCNKFSGITKPSFGNVLQAPCRSCTTPQYAAPAYQAPPYQVPQCQTPQYQAPQYQAPQYQAPQYQVPRWQAPTCQSVPAEDCGCNAYAGSVHNAPCGNGYSSGYGDCGCGNIGEGYSGVADPYLSGGTVLDGSHAYPSTSDPHQPQPGEIINGETVVGPGFIDQGNPYPGTVYPNGSAPVSPDNFQPRPDPVYPQGDYQSRKFDTDGKKILWEEPLPAGANAS